MKGRRWVGRAVNQVAQRAGDPDMNKSERFRPCGGLLGRGDDGGRPYMVEPDAVDAALAGATRDRLEHMDELNQDALQPHAATYRISRRRLAGAECVLGPLAAVAPSSLLSACTALPNV